jgi:hypothetical protein
MRSNTRSKTLCAVVLAIAAMCILAGAFARPTTPAAKTDRFPYPYGSKSFTQLIAESFRENKAGDPRRFYKWFDKTYRSWRYERKPGPGIEDALRIKKLQLAGISDKPRKASAQAAFAGWLHGFVKRAVPKFDLDTGFEFSNAMNRGERQCFLQSVLIAGLLQKAGIDAGVAMVYKGSEGQLSNNGHAITLVKLANGMDVIVDASHPVPFMRQQGLLVRSLDLAYVEPVYASGSTRIRSYLTTSGHRSLRTSQVAPLGFDFIRSQFYYYRGERARDGLLTKKPTTRGLKLAEKNLATSVRLCPENPLALYMLGRAHLAQGESAVAAKEFERAHRLYRRFGWVPQGASEYYALTHRR